MSRFYHALNSRFNIYYNGKTAFDEALASMQKGYKESYSDMILMYPISAQPKEKSQTGGAFDRAIEKSNKAIKLHSIQTKPVKKAGWKNDPKQVKLQSQEEYNPFLKKCWMLMGEAQFYNADFLQASATFSYICRHYKEDDEIVAAAKLWQARCYSEMGWYYESEDILNKLNTGGIPKKNMNQYAAVMADYLIKNQRFEEAIPYMKTAIKAEKDGLQRARMKYLLGQMYTSLELDGLAYKTFGEVVRSNPPYQLEFAARIRQTEVFSSGGNYQKVIKMLQSMAKSSKNKDYLDQVYYAMGNIYLSREDTTQAIKSYELGVEKSTQNGLDKAICQIKLGDLYFEKRDYVKAQPNFSGALSGIQKEYKDYNRISKLSAVLDELVVHVEAVHLQDSLQTLAKMPEKERLAIIDKIIEKVKEDEKRAKEDAEKENYLADQASRGNNINRPGTEAKTTTIPTASGETSFYFYNAQAVAQGKTQFQRKWGRRPLEDDWRRRKKTLSTFDETAQGEGEQLAVDSLADMANADTASVAPVSDDPKTREYYLQQLPMTPEDVEASNVIIEDGLYNMGMIYKDKLENLPLSIQTFAELEKRFPENSHRLESYYQVYLMALRLKDASLQEEYKNKLIKQFPETDYAVAVADPNYEYNVRMMDVVQDSLYEQTYEQYLAENISAVRKSYQTVSEKYPLAKLMPKFMFLDALTYVQAGDPDGFKEALKALLEKYPSADVSELAGEMLKGVLRGRQMVQGGIRGMAWNLRFGAGEDGSLSAADSARVFKADQNVPYRLVMFYPAGQVDKNRLLFSVAAYNFANFMVKQLDMTFEDYGAVSQFILSGFYSFDEIWHYYQMIYGKDGYASALDKSIAIIPISDDNYETLMHGKTLEEYIAFFDENFHEVAPELAARWRARMDEDNTSDDEEEPIEIESIEPTEESTEQKDESVEQTTLPIEPKEEVAAPVVVSDSIQPNPMVSDTIMPKIVQPTTDEEQISTDTIRLAIPQPEKDKGLTLKEIEDIHRQRAEEEAAAKAKARQEEEEKQAAEKAALQQTEGNRAEAEAQQKAEEENLLKVKAEREKQQEAERKEKQKQAANDKKAKLKAREELRKEKEKAYKLRLKQKEKERKEKERANKQKLKDREKARKEALKAKEQARKEKLKK